MSFISCNYCMKKGHIYKNCNAMKHNVPKGFMKWIPRGSREVKPCWTKSIKGYHIILSCFTGYRT